MLPDPLPNVHLHGVRTIKFATSEDFLKWTPGQLADFGDAPPEHLYTNATVQYGRAPQIYVALPRRFLPWRTYFEQMKTMAPGVSDAVFMSSRDGVLFRRWREELIPITAPKDRDGNRSNYMTWGLLQLPGNDRELSVYATEAYYKGPASRVRRFTFRMDGFVSVHAPASGGSRRHREHLLLSGRASTGAVPGSAGHPGG